MGRIGIADAREGGFKGGVIDLLGRGVLLESLTLAKVVSKFVPDSAGTIIPIGIADAREGGFKGKMIPLPCPDR